MKFDVFMKDEKICSVVSEGGITSFENYIDDPLWLPFGVKTSITNSDIEAFFRDRCFPKERANCKTVLKSIGLDFYDPEMICRKTHGTQFDDFIWIRFEGENITYADVRLR